MSLLFTLVNIKHPLPRFRFSLRTLFVVVTAGCVWLGWNVHVTNARKARLKLIEESGSQWYGNDPLPREIQPAAIPWIRRLLGDQPVQAIRLVNRPDTEQREIEALFPEANVVMEKYIGQPPRH